ncbi:MAG TPA: nitroreductase family deazaflavin-dependent oxidoreductase [Candidatus Limnocylindrales bacterium]
MATTRLARMRPFTVRFVNPITRRFAAHAPMFGIIEYTGRKSGKRYRTPMNVFRQGNDWVFALTYGADVQWVKNVMASGHCLLTSRGKTYELTEPRLFVDPKRSQMPTPVRQFLGLLRVTEFLRMKGSSRR